jgi:5-methylcytosine-specific restriction endonuclease McrA
MNVYKDYLKSDKWKFIRRKVLTRANYTCEGCFDARATEVHHLHYKHVYNEFLWELVAICSDCHRRYHEKES